MARLAPQETHCGCIHPHEARCSTASIHQSGGPPKAVDLQRRGPRVPRTPREWGTREPDPPDPPQDSGGYGQRGAGDQCKAQLPSRAGLAAEARMHLLASARADGTMTRARRGPGRHRKCLGGAQGRATRAGVRPRLTRSGPGVATLARRVSGSSSCEVNPPRSATRSPSELGLGTTKV